MKKSKNGTNQRQSINYSLLLRYVGFEGADSLYNMRNSDITTSVLKAFFTGLVRHFWKEMWDLEKSNERGLEHLQSLVSDVKILMKEDGQNHPYKVPKESTLNDIAKEEIKPLCDIVANMVVLGGICVLFGPPGQGKSTLLMQLLIEIASQKGSRMFSDGEFDYAQPIVYLYDIELSDQQIKKRYCMGGITFPENLVRISDQEVMSEESSIIKDIERVMSETVRNSNLVIAIDNITKIFKTMTPNVIKKFYTDLRSIQDKAKEQDTTVTFFIVGHTTKIDRNSAISLADLCGSSYVGNFANTVIALGPSRYGEQVKYLRQLKNNDHEFSDSLVVTLHRVSDPYCQFKVGDNNVPIEDVLPGKNTPNNQENIENDTKSSEEKLLEQMITWHNEGLAQKQMAVKLKKSEMAVSRMIAKWREQKLWPDPSPKRQASN